jgi:hypothetical protein
VNAPDWCAVPVSDLDANALIQTGSNFADVPDLLRSVEDASVASDASTADSTAYRVTVPERESSSAARVEGDELMVWLDDAGRPVRIEFAISQPVAVASEPALATFDGSCPTGTAQGSRTSLRPMMRSRTFPTASSEGRMFLACEKERKRDLELVGQRFPKERIAHLRTIPGSAPRPRSFGSPPRR